MPVIDAPSVANVSQGKTDTRLGYSVRGSKPRPRFDISG
jgi:hypothetical protein